MRAYLDCDGWWAVSGYIVTFYCIKCSGPLVNNGPINQFVCDKCKCIYEMKIEIREITHNENIRKLPAARNSEDDSK